MMLKLKFQLVYDLEDKTIFITGGTGFSGKALTSHIFKNHSNIKKLIIL
jgi:FlaA1/EpsC-like NDP-sugar epimerase